MSAMLRWFAEGGLLMYLIIPSGAAVALWASVAPWVRRPDMRVPAFWTLAPSIGILALGGAGWAIGAREWVQAMAYVSPEYYGVLALRGAAVGVIPMTAAAWLIGTGLALGVVSAGLRQVFASPDARTRALHSPVWAAATTVLAIAGCATLLPWTPGCLLTQAMVAAPVIGRALATLSPTNSPEAVRHDIDLSIVALVAVLLITGGHESAHWKDWLEESAQIMMDNTPPSLLPMPTSLRMVGLQGVLAAGGTLAVSVASLLPQSEDISIGALRATTRASMAAITLLLLLVGALGMWTHTTLHTSLAGFPAN